MNPPLTFLEWSARCHQVCHRLGRAAGHSSTALLNAATAARALEIRASQNPRTAKPAPTERPVAQPNWNRLGFAGPEDAEGRN